MHGTEYLSAPEESIETPDGLPHHFSGSAPRRRGFLRHGRASASESSVIRSEMPMALIDPELLEILVCPETKQRVTLADQALIERLNAAQRAGTLKNRQGTAVSDPMDGGLIREDKAFLYPVVSGIPVMLIDEAIPLKDFTN